jgi:hypothetical protein
MATTVAISRIKINGGTQIREALYDNATLEEYRDAMESGATFPPIVVVEDGDSLWLVDGFHRVAAAQKLGRKTIDANVRQGTLEEAQWLACAANRGLMRTNADKRAAVIAALKHPRSRDLSDRAVATHCGVNHHLVADVRRAQAARNLENMEVGVSPSSKSGSASGTKRTERGGIAAGPSPVATARKHEALIASITPKQPEPAIVPQPDEDDDLDDMDAALGFDELPAPQPAPAAATTPKPARLVDHQGREVPRELVQKWVLLTRQYEATVATIVAAKNAAGQHRAALTRASKTITNGALVRHADLDGWALGRALKQAEMLIERLRPWVVCSECDGTGGEHPAYCNPCGAAGWLCPEDFQQRVDGANARNGKRGAR